MTSRPITKKDGYYTNQHSCFLLQYHLVLVTKYRHPVIINELKETLLEYTESHFRKNNLKLLEVNTDKDHIHIMFEAVPNMNLSVFVNGFKTGSSKIIRSRFQEFLAPYYWKPYFWSSSYFLATVSEKSAGLVRKYIQNQGKDK